MIMIIIIDYDYDYTNTNTHILILDASNEDPQEKYYHTNVNMLK